ncbi:MAG TPA: M14 family zinc carboxypeptidase [Gammaproteobacteria bacterium]|nr:M14 family zinc carboxypeptidase [Gammaproteobacteria bacterium]
MNHRLGLLLLSLCLPLCAAPAFAAEPGADALRTYARDPGQALDQAYTAKIARYTTRPEFNTPLTDYLPASKTVPTPEAVLGDIAGAPNRLPYAEDVYRYFRMLEKATPRVQVFSIGRTEEGREMIAVAIADESLMKNLDANKARLAQLADPRTLGMDDARAAALIPQTHPVYYITGTIHSTETGAPTALMELAYRLAVDDAPYIKYIRSHVITLITPVVEVDGRDRMVDLYRWHRAHPDKNYPDLMYWGHYVAHDNNRDAMAVTLDLTKNVLNTYVGWHAQVLHDLHESVPFLYDNTVGDGPYNAWIDPILTSEWQQIGWNNVEQLTRLGLPGVFTHGDFDTWSPGYLMFIAALHNGISRLYETFGNGGADTEERILDPDEYARTWYKPNPPLPKVLWSQRDNNNYEQSGLLTALYYFAEHREHFLDNFWLKSKRSIEKPQLAGPAAYVLSADDPHKGAQMHLLHTLHLQHVEISRATAPFTVLVADDTENPAGDKAQGKPAEHTVPPQVAAVKRGFPAGSWIVRMDQPYSRIADALLDRQYWSPDDPQKHPYDDTGWSFGDLFGVDVARVVDTSVLKVPMQTVQGDFDQPALTLASLGVKTRGRMPRIALMHTWLSTQTEGWWRMALDRLHVPYSYISTQDAAHDRVLRDKYDVILFAPVGYATTQLIIDGLPMYGNPLPWQKTGLTPNLGVIDSTPDTRPGLGESGVANLKRFVAAGGLLVTSEDTARFAIDVGLATGVSVAKGEAHVVGSVLRAELVNRKSPVVAGYDESFALYSAGGLAFDVANQTLGNRGLTTASDYSRPTGRGGPGDADIPEGRPYQAPPALPDVKAWQAVPLNAEQARNNPFVIPPAMRPDVIVRWADADKLLISGLLENGGKMAGHAAVVDAHYGKGHVLLFANNPIWRGETIGSYALVLNAIVHHTKLDGAANQD